MASPHSSSNFGDQKDSEGWMSVTSDVFLVRQTKACQDAVKDVICKEINGKNTLTYYQLGRVLVPVLGTANLDNALYKKIIKKLKDKPQWRDFFSACLLRDEISAELLRFRRFYEAVRHSKPKWTKRVGGMTPGSVLYIMERLLFLSSLWNGIIYSTKSTLLEWILQHDDEPFSKLGSLAGIQPPEGLLNDVHKFIVSFLLGFSSSRLTENWIRESGLDVNVYLPLFFLRLTVMACLLHLSTGEYFGVLDYMLLRGPCIRTALPSNFFLILERGLREKQMDPEAIAEAFKVVGNPLVVIRGLRKDAAVFVDIRTCHQKELVLQALFPAAPEAESSDSNQGEEAVKPEASNSAKRIKIFEPIV